jgi:hypothetical protein
MSKMYLFYATKDDLLTVTKKMESIGPIKYVRFGRLIKLPESFNRAMEIPNLGVASHPSAVACEKFLICEDQTLVTPRKIEAIVNHRDNSHNSIVNHETAKDKNTLEKFVGVNRFVIDQLLNPDSITFSAGGLWNNDLLLHGSVGTASQSKSSQKLMKRFHDMLKKEFTKVKAFYVGPQALILLNNGKRLTISAQSPQKFDLKPL